MQQVSAIDVSTQLSCGVQSPMEKDIVMDFPPASRPWHIRFPHLWEMLPYSCLQYSHMSIVGIPLLYDSEAGPMQT